MKSIVSIGDPVKVRFFRKDSIHSPAIEEWRDATVACVEKDYKIGVVYADGTRQMLPWDSNSWSAQ